MLRCVKTCVGFIRWFLIEVEIVGDELRLKEIWIDSLIIHAVECPTYAWILKRGWVSDNVINGPGHCGGRECPTHTGTMKEGDDWEYPRSARATRVELGP